MSTTRRDKQKNIYELVQAFTQNSKQPLVGQEKKDFSLA